VRDRSCGRKTDHQEERDDFAARASTLELEASRLATISHPRKIDTIQRRRRRVALFDNA